jgi:hypothetical protein
LDASEDAHGFLLLALRLRRVSREERDLPQKIVALGDKLVGAKFFSGNESALEFQLSLQVSPGLDQRFRNV